MTPFKPLSKIGKALSKISYIFCLIGAIGCAAGLDSLPFANQGIFKIGGVSIYGLIVNRAGIDLTSLYPAITGAMILCIGQMVLAKIAENTLLTSWPPARPLLRPVQRSCCAWES